MGSRSTLAGKEVPIIGSDSVKWIELSVPSSTTAAAAAAVAGDSCSTTLGPPTKDCASCFVIGDPSTYLIWRIHKTQPHTLELMELCASKEFPGLGLRITFPDALCPFAFIWKSELIGTTRDPYLLYALTVSGVAYLLNIKNVSTYGSCSIFPRNEIIEYNVHSYSNHVAISAVTATAGCLVIGRTDGSVFCFQLGVVEQSAPGFVHELRDDSGIGRLWGFMSRKIFSHTMSIPTITGATYVRLWVGHPHHDSSIIPLAILYSDSSEFSSETIYIYNIQCTLGDKMILLMDPSVQNILLEEGGCIDVKLDSDKIWILKDDELLRRTFHTNVNGDEACSYALQEEFIADQLLQSSEHNSDDLLRITHSVFSSAKDHIVPFVSSIFLRRLLLPGVHHSTALRATMMEYNRHFAESEFQLFTADGLKKEILTLIEHEGGTEKMSKLYCWKNFCTRYFNNWCKNNSPCGLFVDSSVGSVGLIRKNSISLFRCLENIERIIEGSSDEVDELTGLVDLFDDVLEREILIEMLRCVINFSQQLGKSAYCIFYESLVNTLVGSPEDIIPGIVKVAKVMFESALDFLLFLRYLVDISGQIHLSHDDITRIQLELVPMIQDNIFEWLLVIFFSTTPSVPAAIEDFSSKLSSLQIDSRVGKRSWNEKLGRCDFTLAFILLLNIGSSSGNQSLHSSECLSNRHTIIDGVREFASWIIWGNAGESSSILSRSTDLALILFRNCQYDAAEYLLTIVEAHLRKEKTSQSIQDADGQWCILHHLLGCCFLAQLQCGLHKMLKEKKVHDAVRCFFRAASGKGSSDALQNLSHDAGLPLPAFAGSVSTAAWKLQYYQWAMQIFELYNISEGACQFALAALEQVDEALSEEDTHSNADSLNESVISMKGRLWANVFKFSLDLSHYYDAYCAIISNPDEESKYICLRRFIIVLYERGAIKILCSNQLPLIGLTEKVEQELAWKAERSDISSKPNLYKLLYAFAMHRHNWRLASSYMYLYSARLRNEAALKDDKCSLLILQERLNALSTATNALHLVRPAFAWIDPLVEGNSFRRQSFPSKKARRTAGEHSESDAQPQCWQSSIDLEKLENEFVLTSAEYLLSLANVKWTFSGIHRPPLDLVDLLVEKNLYDMAFTVILRFFKGSGLRRELERVFSALSLKCCPHKVDSPWAEMHGHLLTSSKGEVVVHGSPVTGPTTQQSDRNSNWASLELYLEKYRGFHARVPVIVAETLLRTDPQIELPLWLVQMFKEGQKERIWGMAGRESSPAALLRLYVKFGRYTEATNLLLEFIESFASLRPSDITKRKTPLVVWFPYTTIEQLYLQLEELISMGHMVDQCGKLKKLLRGALQSHLNLLKVDSNDVISASG
ncbi:Nuclear pore complex protein [Quillaja saponaria]|uniref:Nuclear pore complex protein n=1 Tax=Quillaja saponaria TaxID=32244 RepID=A0AAD7VE75_QUISA|nr:Nuclear pore complex protein [Quillaja saponaria]